MKKITKKQTFFIILFIVLVLGIVGYIKKIQSTIVLPPGIIDPPSNCTPYNCYVKLPSQ